MGEHCIFITSVHMLDHTLFLQHVIHRAQQDVLNNGGVSVTDVTWVMVVTWVGMTPRQYYYPEFEKVSCIDYCSQNGERNDVTQWRALLRLVASAVNEKHHNVFTVLSRIHRDCA